MQSGRRFATHAARCVFYGAASLFALMGMAGCSHSPDFNILGSYFPAWLLCITAGIILTGIIYWGLQRLQVGQHVQPSIVAYPCMAALLAFALWLVLFSR